MSKTYHSSYATVETNNLNLIDVAYRDDAAVIKIERCGDMLGKGYKCKGAQPNSKELRSKSYPHRTVE